MTRERRKPRVLVSTGTFRLVLHPHGHVSVERADGKDQTWKIRWRVATLEDYTERLFFIRELGRALDRRKCRMARAARKRRKERSR